MLALVASVSATAGVVVAPVDTRFVELWRVVGLITFTALFTLLAWRPVGQSALWCILSVSKAALTIAAIVIGPSVPGASDAALWDGLLTVLLVAGLLLALRAGRSTPQDSPAD